MSQAPVSSPAAPGARNNVSARTLGEIAFLLVFPALAYLCLNFEPLMQTRSLDPFFYTGYINNFSDLVQRYGMNYYNVRFGLILPARILTAMFGPESAFFIFRYLLALTFGIPLYAAARRFLSPPVAILAYAALMTSPFVARILLWDHPDAAGAPYLTAAICIFLLEQRPSRFWDFGAGCLAALAAHSNIFTVPIFVIFVGVYSAVWLAHGKTYAALVHRILLLVAAGALVTAGGIVYYWIATGHPNIFYPTLVNVLSLSRGGMERWRTPGFRWMLSSGHVFLPVWLSLCCLAVFARRRLSFFGGAVALFGVAATAFLYAHQFLLRGDTLQLPYYFSYLAPAIFLMLAFLLHSLQKLAQLPSAVFVGATLAALALPWILLSYGVRVSRESALTLFAALAAALLVLLILFTKARGRYGVVISLAGAVLLGIGFDAGFATYDFIIKSRLAPRGADIDVYRVALQLIHAVPKYQDHRGKILFWYNGRNDESLNSIKATYLWDLSNVSGDAIPAAPELNAEDLRRVNDPAVRYVALLGSSADEISREAAALRERNVRFRETDRRTLTSGEYRVYWDLLELQPQ